MRLKLEGLVTRERHLRKSLKNRSGQNTSKIKRMTVKQKMQENNRKMSMRNNSVNRSMKCKRKEYQKLRSHNNHKPNLSNKSSYHIQINILQQNFNNRTFQFPITFHSRELNKTWSNK